jgi:RNA polymerase primary sigma factor
MNAAIADESCVGSYFSSITRFSLLNQVDEERLAVLKNQGDEKAREALIKGNLRLVIRIAKSYIHFEPSLIDLIQEGNIGLIRAAEKFDPTMGCRFSTYASYWIKHYITRFIAKTGRSIRVPIRKSDLFKKLQVERDHFVSEFGSEPSIRDLSLLLGVSDKEVSELMECCQSTVSLETPLSSTDSSLHDVVFDGKTLPPESVYARKEMVSEIDRAMNSLVDNEKQILRMRFGFDEVGTSTLKEAGASLGVSAETVRQIEMRAIDKIRRQFSYLQHYMD